jgi:dUTP pyrophosphatase
MESFLKVKRLHPDAVLPQKAHDTDAGYDLSSVEDKVINGRDWAWIDVGLAISVPHGTYGRVAPRSGMSGKGTTVGAGVIDENFNGNLKVLIFNLGPEPLHIKKSDRIAQLILEKIEHLPVLEVEELTPTQRGTKGFGSTGV